MVLGDRNARKDGKLPRKKLQSKSMEKGKGCSQADQVEFRNRRLLVHTDIQEKITPTLETDAERYVKVYPEAPGQV